MKKIFVLIFFGLLLSGCVNINNSSYDQLIEDVALSDVRSQNTYRRGYKFYLPVGLNIEDSKEYNEVIKKDDLVFYLYIDLIGYLNKDDVALPQESSIYYKELVYGDKKGYAEIKKTENEKYLVEIVYNYAKIEVIVEEEDLNSTVTEAIIVLASIEYNDSFLSGLSEESLLSYKEEFVDIFNKDTTKDTTNFLKYEDELDIYNGTDSIPDYDMIKGSDWYGFVQ